MELIEENSKFSKEEIDEIKRVSDIIYDDLNVLDNRIITKNFIFYLVLALISSIPIPSIISYLNKHDNENNEKYILNLYNEYKFLKKENFNSKNIQIKTKAKYEYYEKAFQKRIRIQNINWDYAFLDRDVSSFIQAREIIKITYFNIKNLTKKDYLPCPICSTKWLKNLQEDCPRCSKQDELTMFIKISNILCILGDMDLFYKNLEKKTKAILYDNWKHVLSFFENKRNKRKHTLWSYYRSEYGINQYNKIIKIEGGEWGHDKNLIEFNKKHNLALVEGTIKIDLSEGTGFKNDNFLDNLEKIRFPFCDTLTLPAVPLDSKLNNFKPNIPKLINLDASNCLIKEINLKKDFFPLLRKINLDNNLIEKYENIKDLKNIETLRLIDLNNNPIEKTNEIFRTEKLFGRSIEIRYNTLRKYNNTKWIDEETDEDLKRIAKENIYFNESESEKSKTD